MAITLLQSVASKIAQMETSCLMDAFRVAACADNKYEAVAFQDSFSVLLEPNGICLCSCAFSCQHRLPCRHARKVMLATASPATVHSVAARGSFARFLSIRRMACRAQEKTKKTRSLSHRRCLPLLNAVTLGSFSKKGCNRPLFVQLRHLRACRRRSHAGACRGS